MAACYGEERNALFGCAHPSKLSNNSVMGKRWIQDPTKAELLLEYTSKTAFSNSERSRLGQLVFKYRQ